MANCENCLNNLSLHLTNTKLYSFNEQLDTQFDNTCDKILLSTQILLFQKRIFLIYHQKILPMLNW